MKAQCLLAGSDQDIVARAAIDVLVALVVSVGTDAGRVAADNIALAAAMQPIITVAAVNGIGSVVVAVKIIVLGARRTPQVGVGELIENVLCLLAGGDQDIVARAAIDVVATMQRIITVAAAENGVRYTRLTVPVWAKIMVVGLVGGQILA